SIQAAVSRKSMADQPVANDFILLVYPFQHGLSSPARSQEWAALAGRWQPWWSRLDGETVQETLDGTYYFLPYIRKLLCPEPAHLPATAVPGQVAAAVA